MSLSNQGYTMDVLKCSRPTHSRIDELATDLETLNAFMTTLTTLSPDVANRALQRWKSTGSTDIKDLLQPGSLAAVPVLNQDMPTVGTLGSDGMSPMTGRSTHSRLRYGLTG